MNPRARRPLLVALVVSAGLTAALYWRALGLPFYSDDLLQILWVRATPLLDVWRSVGPYGDYRPLHFSLWKVLHWLGLLSPSPVHALNLLAHATCGTLIGLVAARWSARSALAAALGAALFAVFPFALDTVPWAVSFSYPLALSLALGALLVFLRNESTDNAIGRESTSRHVFGLLLTAMAGFAHEGGIVAGPVIFLAGLLFFGRRALRPALLYVAASGVPLALILLFSPAGSAYTLNAANWGGNLIVALQAFAYPVAPIATLAPRIGWSANLGMIVAGIAALLVLAVCAMIHHGAHGERKVNTEPLVSSAVSAVRFFVFGLAWAILWSAVPLLTQQFDWLRDPPRVLYASAAGIALMWSAGLLSIAPRRPKSARGVAWCVAALACLLPAALFLNRGAALYKQAGDLLWDVIQWPGGEAPTLFVNLPGRITPPGRTYPLGHEGVIPMPPPSNADLLVDANAGRAGAAFERSAGAILPALPYAVELAGEPGSAEDIRGAGQVIVTAYHADGSMALEEAGAVLFPSQPGEPAARFGESLLLLTAECRRDGGRVMLTTTWQMMNPAQGAPTVFAHLLQADGSLAAQADGDPIRGLYPLAQWQAGETVRDVRAFEGTPSDAATVAFGVWDPAAGARWAALDAGGARLTADAVRCSIQ